LFHLIALKVNNRLLPHKDRYYIDTNKYLFNKKGRKA
jgi:hypothetical protein